MTDIPRDSLFGKLNPIGYKALEGATTFCKLRGNPYVELSHWLHQIVLNQDSDVHHIIRAFELDSARIAADFQIALDGLPRGASSISDFSVHVVNAVERAWSWASLKYGQPQVRTGHIIVAMLKSDGLKNGLLGLSTEFGKINPDQLADEFEAIVQGSPEAALVASDGSGMSGGESPGVASGAMAPAELGRGEALAQFTIDMTAAARDGEIDPVVGRDDEIRQIVDILMRRRQNNPLLAGEAGVGKTAVVEGFARRIAAGDIPPALKDVSLLSLDVGLLQAGASMKGEFEKRLRQVIDEVQASPKPIVLFIDEVHTLVGAGGAAGTGDAANLLKPALARGSLRTIGATTWAEYKKYIEKDPALTRRFQTVKIDEPDEEKATRMMRGVVSAMEKHHRVQVLDEALEASVRLAHRYIPDRQLPDKSVSLLDTACARVAISHHGTPAEVEDSQRRIEALTTELEIIGRESVVGIETGTREQDARTARGQEEVRQSELREIWDREKTIVDEILSLRAVLRMAASEGDESDPAAEPLGESEIAKSRERLSELQAELTEVQAERPLVHPCVDEQAVASVVADWTGIPVGRMVSDEISAVLELAKSMGQRVIGQDHALEMIAKRVQTARAGLENPGKPIGVFMLAGPSGVGKTETALTLAETLYGGEQNLITINMSEFQEAHTVSTLKGAPPGYVGYGEGGVLTEAVRRKPYSVVLLDEVEKAHPDVHEIFFQVFDKGIMEDGEGRLIDFKNTIIVLTTNVGTDLIMGMCSDPELMPDPEGISKALRRPLLDTFPAALLGRIVTIPYYPLSDEMMGKIVRLQLDRVVRRVRENQGVDLSYTEDVVAVIVSRCTEPESGGRTIDAVLTNVILPQMSRQLLERIVDGSETEAIDLRIESGEFVAFCR